MTATAAEVVITEPGLYPTVTAEQYHADPVAGGSLSSTGARALLPPSCPALFRYWADHPREHRKAWDIGHAAHRLVLGAGADFAVIEHDEWRTKAAKAEVAEARAAGLTPIKPAEHEQVQAMAAAIRAHPLASVLLAPEFGLHEATIVWRDPVTGVQHRAMLDTLQHRPPGGRRSLVVDYKSTASAEPEALRSTVHRLGYHQQEDLYRDAVEHGLGWPRPGFLFVFQEKTPPYLVTIVELDPVAQAIGAARNHWARTTYRTCLESGNWPAYVEGVHMLALPRWVEREEGALV